MNLPERQSLIMQTAKALRQGISRGVWRKHLPGERVLAKQLTVCRPTVRFALDVLEREGWITAAHAGRNRAIIRRPRQFRKVADRRVILLYNELLHSMQFRVLSVVNALRRRLEMKGIKLDVRMYPDVKPSRMGRALQRIVDEQPASAWILTRASLEIQQWFAGRNLPVLINGTCYPGVALPSFATDHRAVCRHAAGLFLGKGHRRMVMPAARVRAAGDDESEDEFRSALMRQRSKDVRCRILKFDGSRRDLLLKLDELYREWQPPVAVLCALAAHALTVFCHARQSGLRVPEDVSIVSRMHDPMLTWTCPVISHYREDIDLLEKKLSSLVLNLVDNGQLPPKDWRLVPEFEPGATVGEVPASCW
ncbi:MAG: substrate-binding domain-containing protein [Kiritimatiellia bacterium]|nr:substrate-binding domain-containing protein [Lentisphaerota bacterium]